MKRTGIPGELPMSSTLATSIASAPIRTSAVKASPIGTGPSTTAFRGPLAKHAVPGGGHARKQPLGSGFAAGEEPGSWASDDAGGDEPSDYDLNHPYYADDGDDEPFSDQDADLVSDSDSNGDGEENASHAPEAHPADAQNFDPDDDHDRQAGDSNSGAEVRSQKPKAAEAGHASPPKKDAPKATRRKRDALKASVVPDHLRQTATGRAYNLVRRRSPGTTGRRAIFLTVDRPRRRVFQVERDTVPREVRKRVRQQFPTLGLPYPVVQAPVQDRVRLGQTLAGTTIFCPPPLGRRVADLGTG